MKTVPASATGAGGYSVSTGYDNRGLQAWARFGHIWGEGISNHYDGFGRLVSSTTNMGGVSRTLSYVYDADGNRTSLQGDGGYSGYGAGFAFDGLGRMTGYDSAARIAYDDSGRRSRLGMGWGGDMSSTTYGYDGLGRLSSLAHDLAGATRDVTFGFTGYNPASQLLGRTASNDAYAWTGSYALNRPYAVNGLNQYTAAGEAAFAYDANGNLASDGSTSFVYDAENRLVSASGAKCAALAYDPLGRLWRVTGASGTRELVYDGDKLLLEYDGGGALLRVYVHGPGTDEPIAWNEIAGGGGLRFLHADQQGSIVAVSDGAGNPVATNSYDEYGIPGAANQGRFGYTGQTWLPELGLWYYKARVYSPTLGRFLQTDPIGYDDQINLYAYMGDDPVNSTDPDGKIGRWVVGAIAGMITEVAIQTVVERKSLKDVDLGDVAIAGVQGALGQGIVRTASRLYKHYNKARQASRAVNQAQARVQRASSLRQQRNASYHADRRAAQANGAYRELKKTGDIAAAALLGTEGAKRVTPPVTVRKVQDQR